VRLRRIFGTAFPVLNFPVKPPSSDRSVLATASIFRESSKEDEIRRNRGGLDMACLKMRIAGFMALLAAVLFFCSAGVFGLVQDETADTIKVTILYDNYVHTEGTKADWGFACLIEGTEKTILFDTGTRPDILWHNLETLDVNISRVDQIVLSHIHGDHTGGLHSVLEKHHDVSVYVPASFPEEFVSSIEDAGAEAVRVSDPVQICEDVHLTGEIKGPANEISLILDTSEGLVVITGCAHPGIVGIVNKSKEILDKEVYFVLGGFHLMETPTAEVKKIIQQFSEAGVIKCGATHCTGDIAIEVFKEAYGDNYVSMGVGKVIALKK
jgi:7,8-dihydropterin-6-yl-methyl-4-(beta-D-ribofuranosyl)aminobenzene 5'-phosphate synthase